MPLTEEQRITRELSPSPPRSGGEGRGEVARFSIPLALTFSPHGRGEGNFIQRHNFQ